MKVNLVAGPASALLLLLASCTGADSGRVIQIAAADADSSRLLAVPFFWSGVAPNGQQQAWLAAGSFLMLDDAPIFPYQSGDSSTLHLEFSDWATRLSGQIVSLNLGEDSALAWVAQAPEDQLIGLRFIHLGDSLRPEFQSAIERLAVVNPTIGIDAPDAELMKSILPLFTPRSISVSSVHGMALAPAQVAKLEWLALWDADSDDVGDVSRMPRLRYLLIEGFYVGEILRLPGTLEALTVTDGEISVASLGNLSRLQRLDLGGSTWIEATDLATLQKLRWLGLPTNATQVEFAALIAAHPKLEVLQIFGVDSVTDLAPLAGARHLRAISLDGEFANLGVLQGLPSLEFVGFSDAMVKSVPAEIAAIRAALPGAAVVQVTGFCLGSGWILLLVPAVLLIVMARPARRAA